MVAEPTAASTPLSSRELEEEARARGFDRSSVPTGDASGDTHLPASESDMLKDEGHSSGNPAPATMLPPD
jgi:hypothetical protein